MSAGDRLRLVLDPNILVSAAIKPGGSAEQALLAWEDERMDLLVCPTLLGEVGNVMARAKFSSVISPDLGRRYATLLEQEATFVADPKDPPRETPDPKDDYLPALGRAGAADFLASGDRKHLPADPTARPPVVTLRQLLDLLAERPVRESELPPARRSLRLAAWRDRRQQYQRSHAANRERWGGTERGV